MLIPLESKALKENGVIFTRKTLYKWHSTGEHPELFLKFGYKVCLDLRAWQNWVETARKETQIRVKRLKELKEGVK